MNYVGRIVKEKRENKGLSQNQLAKRAGVSQAALNALESRTSNPSVETVFLLAEALDCTVTELLGEKPVDISYLSPLQEQLIAVFDQLNDAGKLAIISFAKSILQQPCFKQEGTIPSVV